MADAGSCARSEHVLECPCHAACATVDAASGRCACACMALAAFEVRLRAQIAADIAAEGPWCDNPHHRTDDWRSVNDCPCYVFAAALARDGLRPDAGLGAAPQ